MKTTTHKYKGYVITGFNLRQLGDSTVSGMIYNVYEAGGRGVGIGESLSSTADCLIRLSLAKEFIDSLTD